MRWHRTTSPLTEHFPFTKSPNIASGDRISRNQAFSIFSFVSTRSFGILTKGTTSSAKHHLSSREGRVETLRLLIFCKQTGFPLSHVFVYQQIPQSNFTYKERNIQGRAEWDLKSKKKAPTTEFFSPALGLGRKFRPLRAICPSADDASRRPRIKTERRRRRKRGTCR